VFSIQACVKWRLSNGKDDCTLVGAVDGRSARGYMKHRLRRATGISRRALSLRHLIDATSSSSILLVLLNHNQTPLSIASFPPAS
jgi:hypothetical protein